MGEKRKNRRYPKRYRVRFGEVELSKTGFTENISSSGLFVVTTWMPKLGSLIHLEVTGLDEQRFLFSTEVKRVVAVEPQLRQIKRGGFGVRFLTPAELVSRLVPRAAEEQVTVRFDDQQAFARIFERELAQGGLVVNTPKAPLVNAILQVQFQLGFANEMLELTSRVVQVGPNSTGAMTVAVVFSDKEAALTQLRPYLPK